MGHLPFQYLSGNFRRRKGSPVIFEDSAPDLYARLSPNQVGKLAGGVILNDIGIPVLGQSFSHSLCRERPQLIQVKEVDADPFLFQDVHRLENSAISAPPADKGYPGGPWTVQPG